ncbi:HAD family hydrolase [Oxalobacteraceae bacterium A2-2]
MSLHPPQAILFDLDDTFWPVGPVIAAAEHSWHAWLAERAPAVTGRYTVEELRRRRYALAAARPELMADLAELRAIVLREACDEVGAGHEHVAGSIRHFVAERSKVTLYEDVLPVLAWLQGRVKLGVITNGNADLEVIGLGHHFEVNLSSARHGKAKPDPSIFLAACAALGVAPADAVYVGDDLQLDVVGAQGAGLRAVWINRAGSQAHLEQDVRPDAICGSFTELLSWLQRELTP